MTAELSGSYLSDVNAKREVDPVGHAHSILLRFPLWKLKGASVCVSSVPDTSNPSEYYDRFVLLEYKSYFGIPCSRPLYVERCAFRRAFDEKKQEAVVAHAAHFLRTINVVL